MDDDERLSDIFKTIKKNKRVTLQKKNSQTPGHPIRSNSAFSPDQLELQIINGLLNLQSIPETPNLHSSVIKSTAQPENQAPIQGYEEEAAPKNPLVLPASNPNNKRKCREKSISIASGKSLPPAGKKRGNEKSSRNIKSQLDINGQHETGGLQQFVQAVGKENVCANSIQDNSIKRHCQQDEDLKKTASRAIIMEENHVSSQNEQNFVEGIALEGPLILSGFDAKHEKRSKGKVKVDISENSRLYVGRKCACHKINEDKRNRIRPNFSDEIGDGKQYVEVVGHENQREICKSFVDDNSIELHCQRNDFLEKLEAFALDANILQDTSKGEENNSQEIRKCLVLDEDKRELIAQNMVKICQNNSQVRNTFLELLNVLVEGGLLRFVALKVLSQGPCEEAQEVLNILDKSKTEPNSAHNLTALLHAVEKDTTKKNLTSLKQETKKLWQLFVCLVFSNMLHKAGDAFRSVSHLQDSKLFAIRYINQGSWEIQWHTACQTRS